MLVRRRAAGDLHGGGIPYEFVINRAGTRYSKVPADENQILMYDVSYMAPTVDQEIQRNLSDEHRLVLLNLLHDPRIGPERKRELDKILPRFAGRVASLIPEAHEIPYRVQRVVRVYYRERVAVLSNPDYINPVLNGNNFVPLAKPGSTKGIHPETRLVHVIDLAKFARAFKSANLPGAPGTGATQQQIIDWLRRHVPAFPETTVPGRSSGEVKGFVDKALQAIHQHDPLNRRKPTWVALWEQFKAHVSSGPNVWLQVLGLADTYSGAPRYPLVLVYPAHKVGTLLRPTQLDAEFNAMHFPSPPVAPVTAGGFTMDRAAIPGSREPLSEYLHEPRLHSAVDWNLGGQLTGPTNVATNSVSLIDARRRHYQRLRSKYPAIPDLWMRDATCLA